MKKDRVILNDDWCRELTSGTLYFHVGFREPGVNLPEITSLVYLGEEMSDGTDENPSHGMFIFQKADSYQEIGDWSTLPEIRQREISLDVLLAFDVGKTIGICDLEGLIHRLRRLQKLNAKGLGWERALPEDGHE